MLSPCQNDKKLWVLQSCDSMAYLNLNKFKLGLASLDTGVSAL